MNNKVTRCVTWLWGALVAAYCATANAQSGDTSSALKIGYVSINFRASSGELIGPLGTTPRDATAVIDSVRTATLVYEHRVSGPWSVVTQIGAPPTLQFKGAGSAAAVGQIGSAKAWFPAVLATYSFIGLETSRPYVGIGANYAFFTQRHASLAYNRAFGGTSSTVGLKSSLGAVAKLGIEIPISNRWMVDIAYSRYWINTTATIVTVTPGIGSIQREAGIKATPEAFGVSLGHRF